LDQTIKLPEWTERAAASPDEQAKWDTGVAGLRQHEDTHAASNRQQAEQLDKSLPGTQGRGQAKSGVDARNKARADLTTKEQQKLDRNLEATRKRQTKLDDDTLHGTRKQP
jgi:predicted secreted Zn-dependent protease